MGQQSWNGIFKKHGRSCWLLSRRSDGNSAGQRCWTSTDELEIPCSPLEHCAHSDTTARNQAGLRIRCQWSCSSRGVTWSATPTKLCDIVIRLSYERYVTLVLLRQVQTSDWMIMWLWSSLIIFTTACPTAPILTEKELTNASHSHLVLRWVYMLSFHNKCVNHGSCGP